MWRGVREREWVSAETRHSSDCLSTCQAVWKPQSHSLTHQFYSFPLYSQAFSSDVHGQNPQLLLIRVLVPWAQTMKLLTRARGEKKKERPGKSETFWSTPCASLFGMEWFASSDLTVYMTDTLGWWTPGCLATSELFTRASQNGKNNYHILSDPAMTLQAFPY